MIVNKEINWYEEVKQDFTKNISDSYTLNLAMSILEDRKNLLNDNLDLQNNWNELKKCIGEWITYHSVCDEDYKELNVLLDVESKMQELEQGKDE